MRPVFCFILMLTVRGGTPPTLWRERSVFMFVFCLGFGAFAAQDQVQRQHQEQHQQQYWYPSYDHYYSILICMIVIFMIAEILIINISTIRFIHICNMKEINN